MTALEAILRLIEAVESEKKVAIPTPHWSARETHPDWTARIMGYAEGYVMLRHKGASPFCISKKEVIDQLRAQREQIAATEASS